MTLYYIHTKDMVYHCYKVEAESRDEALQLMEDGDDRVEHLDELEEVLSSELTEITSDQEGTEVA